MTPPEATAPGPNGPWPVFDVKERRVLGVMVEKAKTTPDSYPMSLNALIAGCNQKSNREPVMDLEDVEVEDTLSRLQKKGLVVRVTLTSSRVDKWKHLLYDAWHLADDPEMREEGFHFRRLRLCTPSPYPLPRGRGCKAASGGTPS